jgi:protein-tyrosine-phosphatase
MVFEVLWLCNGNHDRSLIAQCKADYETQQRGWDRYIVNSSAGLFVSPDHCDKPRFEWVAPALERALDYDEKTPKGNPVIFTHEERDYIRNHMCRSDYSRALKLLRKAEAHLVKGHVEHRKDAIAILGPGVSIPKEHTPTQFYPRQGLDLDAFEAIFKNGGLNALLELALSEDKHLTAIATATSDQRGRVLQWYKAFAFEPPIVVDMMYRLGTGIEDEVNFHFGGTVQEYRQAVRKINIAVPLALDEIGKILEIEELNKLQS